MNAENLEDRFVGSLLGLALADALGAGYEGGPLGTVLWKIVGGHSGGVLHWTDDTEMAIGLAESLIECGGLDADHLARRWAAGMKGWRGYGPGARRLLKLIRQGEDWRAANLEIFPDGSFGNGAAMRAAPLGLFFHRDSTELVRAAELASRITHAHPLGIGGGVLIARATARALQGFREPAEFLGELESSCEHEEYRGRLRVAREFLDGEPTPRAVRRELGTSVVAHESAVTAVYAFCRFPDDYTAMVEYIIGLGGDTDTIGAMAGGIFGAKNGAASLPEEPLESLEQRKEIEDLARRLHAALPT